jgi:hypothetical protein
MLPGDAWLWSRYRDDEELMKKFKQFTEKQFDKKRGLLWKDRRWNSNKKLQDH